MKSTIIVLTENTRELFKQMSFPEIPESAKYVAFLEDGEAAFFEELKMPALSFPKMTMISSYEVTDLQIEY